jgi:uncharacterized protein with HEPN domain
MKKDPLIFIEHILGCIKNIEGFMKSVNKKQFFDNLEKQSAVIRQIEIIGEAARNVSSELRGKYPKVPWSQMVGMKNKLIHNYLGVNIKIVWSTVKEDIPN